MKRNKSWYEITKKFNNIPYVQSSVWKLDEGIDCIGMIILFMKELDIDVNDFMNGYKGFTFNGKYMTRFDYLDKLESEQEMLNALIAFVEENCDKTDKLEKGDIVISKIKNYGCVSIYMGKGRFMATFKDIGIDFIKIDNKDIKDIYKWRQE